MCGFVSVWMAQPSKKVSLWQSKHRIALIALEQSGLTPRAGERMTKLKSHCSYTIKEGQDGCCGGQHSLHYNSVIAIISRKSAE